jgi:hypothetical protein
LGIIPHLFAGPVEAWPLRLASGTSVTAFPVRFLNVSTLIARKNLLGLLRVWLRATRAGDGALLLVKLGDHLPDAWLHFQHHVDQVQRELGTYLHEAAPVHLIEGLLSDAHMPRLYRVATHYISMSHGEGWDQAMMEAAASGLGLIAPNHSAYTAYLDVSTARLIPSRVVPTGEGGLFAGLSWWQPDEDVAVAHVRAAIAGERDDHFPRERILTRMTWGQAARHLLDLLGELETNRRRRFWPALPWSRRA